MNDRLELAKLIIGDDIYSLDELEKMYPKRSELVTRFAPSPTGFLHTGSLFTAFVTSKIAHDQNGVFYLRIEDTDTQRTIEGSDEAFLDTLNRFNINVDEGYNVKGIYGPYKQSERFKIYNSVIFYLLVNDLAYPCFCNKEKLEEIRNHQVKNKLNIGYYKEFACCRDLSVLEAIKKIKNNEPFVIRFKANGDGISHILVHDLIRGDLELTANYHDIIIRKADLLPTYHFAHVVDDYFMRTTIVIRGEEWLSSLPIHLEMFNALNWKSPDYAHLPVIMKQDNEKRRKLSKRLDKEASVDYLLKDGYLENVILEYLLTIANSNFEEWRSNNRNASINEFKLDFGKFSLDGALFDIEKINSISKDYLGNLSGEEMAFLTKKWAKEFSNELINLIDNDYQYFVSIMSIEKDKENRRKDYIKFSEVMDKIKFFYDVEFDKLPNIEAGMNKEIANKALDCFLDCYKNELPEEEWLLKLKDEASKIGFAKNKKEMQEKGYEYMFKDFMGIIRLALTKSVASPNIYYVIKIISAIEIERRINIYKKTLD